MSVIGFGAIELFSRQRALEKWQRQHRWHQLFFYSLVVISVSLLTVFSAVVYLSRASSTTNFSLTINGIDICGDGAIDLDETCDDGSLYNGLPNRCNDTCSGTTAAVCGNSVIESGEQCDDGNTTNGDGCSASCQTEASSPPPAAMAKGGGLILIGPPILPAPKLVQEPPATTTEPLPDINFLVNIIDPLQQKAAQSVRQNQITQVKIINLGFKRPIFQGSSNIGFALVRLVVHSHIILNAVVAADAKGNWQWQPSQDLEVGPHELLITVYSADGSRILMEELILQFYVSETGGPSDITKLSEAEKKKYEDYAIIDENGFEFREPLTFKSLGSRVEHDLRVVTKREYRSGDPVEAAISVNNYDESHQMMLDYEILDANGEEIFMQQSESYYFLAGSNSYSRSFQLATPLAAGYYQLVVSIHHQNVTAASSDVFRIYQPQLSALGTFNQQQLIWLQALGALLVMFLLASLLEFKYLNRLGRLQHPISAKDFKKLGYI